MSIASTTGVSAKDGVALLLDSAFDGVEVDRAFVEAHVDGGVRHGHLYLGDSVQGSNRTFETGLAVAAVNLWNL